MKAILRKYVETLDNDKRIVVKQYKPTGRNIDSIHIQQENGRIWYCPISDLIYVKEESYDKWRVYIDKSIKAYDNNYMGIFEKERITIPEITIVKMG